MAFDEREDLIEQIAALEGARAGWIERERWLHEWFMVRAPSDKVRLIGRALDLICIRLDALSDQIGLLKARLYQIEAHRSRREKLADAAYGGM